MALKVLNGLGIIRTKDNDLLSPSGGSKLLNNGTVVSTDLGEKKQRFPFGESAFAGNFDVAKNTNNENIVVSQYSNEGSFSTLFNNLLLEVIPCYNFYVPDEEINENEELGNRKLADVPRYNVIKWKRSPNLKKNRAFGNKKIRSHGFNTDFGKKSNIMNGLEFKKDKSNEFSIAKKMTANGYVSPGSINTIIEIENKKNTDVSDKKIDELKYLNSNSKISIHDLQKALNYRKNGLLKSISITNSDVVGYSNSEKEKLFNGNFSIDTSDNSIDVDGLMADSPVLSMKINTVKQSKTGQKKDFVNSSLEQFVNHSSNIQNSSFTEVNFFDTSIHGLVNEEKINLMTKPEHIENMAAIGQYLPNLTIMSLTRGDIKIDDNIPSMQSDDIEDGTEYIGYVIEKYKLDKSGIFNLIEEIDIPKPDITEYIDTKVLYGTTYRYRIKTIIKWTHEGGKSQIGKNNKSSSQTKKLLNKNNSFFYSEWNRKWQYSSIIDNLPPYPPDEFMIRPDSSKKRVVLSWKLPLNEQRDISHYRIFKRVIKDNLDLGEWEVLAVVEGSKNGLFIDNDVDYYQNDKSEYIYCAQSLTTHSESSLLSTQLKCKLNSKYRTDDEFEITHVSEEGIDVGIKGALSVKPAKISNNRFTFFDKCNISSRLGIHNELFDDITYIIRLESLDKSVTQDVTVNFRYDNVSPLIQEKISPTILKNKISNNNSKNNNRQNSIAVGTNDKNNAVINEASNTKNKAGKG